MHTVFRKQFTFRFYMLYKPCRCFSTDMHVHTHTHTHAQTPEPSWYDFRHNLLTVDQTHHSSRSNTHSMLASYATRFNVMGCSFSSLPSDALVQADLFFIWKSWTFGSSLDFSELSFFRLKNVKNVFSTLFPLANLFIFNFYWTATVTDTQWQYKHLKLKHLLSFLRNLDIFLSHYLPSTFMKQMFNSDRFLY